VHVKKMSIGIIWWRTSAYGSFILPWWLLLCGGEARHVDPPQSPAKTLHFATSRNNTNFTYKVTRSRIEGDTKWMLVVKLCCRTVAYGQQGNKAGMCGTTTTIAPMCMPLHVVIATHTSPPHLHHSIELSMISMKSGY